MKIKYLILSLFLTGILHAQKVASYDLNGIFMDVNLAYGSPFGKLSDRFGPHFSFGVGLSYQPSKGIDFGAKFQYFFSRNVREDVLAPYRTDFGQIIGEDFFLTDVVLRERGYFSYIYFGGIIPLASQAKARHGIRWMLGPGFIQHRIRIQDDSRAATQLFSDFGRGLDRLTNGFCAVGFMGYEFKSLNGRINFYTGIETVFGFTQGRRQWNYDTEISELSINRNDNLIQFKFGWYLPFFIKKPESLEY